MLVKDLIDRSQQPLVRGDRSCTYAYVRQKRQSWEEGGKRQDTIFDSDGSVFSQANTGNQEGEKEKQSKEGGRNSSCGSSGEMCILWVH